MDESKLRLEACIAESLKNCVYGKNWLWEIDTTSIAQEILCCKRKVHSIVHKWMKNKSNFLCFNEMSCFSATGHWGLSGFPSSKCRNSIYCTYFAVKLVVNRTVQCDA